MNQQTMRARGFTLIEILIVIAIIALLAGVVGVSLAASRAKASDAKTVSTVSAHRSAFSAASSGTPNPGDASNYYCAGKSSTETCEFWGQTLSGNDSIAEVIHDYIGGSNSSVPTVTISGMSFDAVAYKCKSVDTGACEAAIYWAQSPHTSCIGGIQIYENDNGRVCSSDADAYSSSNVESAPASFLSAAGSSNDDEESSGPTFSLPSTITLAQGVIATDPVSQKCFVVDSIGFAATTNAKYADFRIGDGMNGCANGAGVTSRQYRPQPLRAPGAPQNTINGIAVWLAAVSDTDATFNLSAGN